VADNKLIEKAISRVHDKHEGKGQHEKQSENNKRSVIFEFKEEVCRFYVSCLFFGSDDAFFG
jgi:hypothetical protein